MLKPNTLDVSVARADQVGSIAGGIFVAAVLIFAVSLMAMALGALGTAFGLGGLADIGNQVATAGLPTFFFTIGLAIVVWVVGIVAWVR